MATQVVNTNHITVGLVSQSWKSLKRKATHNQYFPEFELLTISVDQALARYVKHPDQVKNLMWGVLPIHGCWPAPCRIVSQTLSEHL